MKIALLGDIHANLPALQAVLAHAGAQGIKYIWNAGDSIGYGPYPDQTIRFLKKHKITSIAGNYDLKVLEIKKKAQKWSKKKLKEKFFAFLWAYQRLSKGSRKYLKHLPQERCCNLKGWNILLTHGSPASNEEHLTESTPKERLAELAHLSKADIIICGHSHLPFSRKVGNTWFINTGSVGRPDDGDPRACYAVLSLKPDFIKVAHYRIAYDIVEVVTEMRAQKLPDEYAQMLMLGRSLDVVISTSA